MPCNPQEQSASTDRCPALTNHVGQAWAKASGTLRTLECVAVGGQMITVSRKQAV